MAKQQKSEVEIALIMDGWQVDGSQYRYRKKYRLVLPEIERPWWTVQAINRRGVCEYFVDLTNKMEESKVLACIRAIVGDDKATAKELEIEASLEETESAT